MLLFTTGCSIREERSSPPVISAIQIHPNRLWNSSDHARYGIVSSYPVALRQAQGPAKSDGCLTANKLTQDDAVLQDGVPGGRDAVRLRHRVESRR